MTKRIRQDKIAADIIELQEAQDETDGLIRELVRQSATSLGTMLEFLETQVKQMQHQHKLEARIKRIERQLKIKPER